jgi:hypothetical protein
MPFRYNALSQENAESSIVEQPYLQSSCSQYPGKVWNRMASLRAVFKADEDMVNLGPT